MGRAALVVGVSVFLVTVASQAGLLGGHDFVTVAVLGLLGAVFCAVVCIGSRTRPALAGLVFSLLPVALLGYYLAVSDG